MGYAMSADDIREYCRIRYIEPARSAGSQTVTIRAGDVHKSLGLKDRTPQVVSALAVPAFEVLCGVKLVSRAGPNAGANTMFTYTVERMKS
jgi:5-methylcytosine-specific restriction protein B